jgi:hypothetical protein
MPNNDLGPLNLLGPMDEQVNEAFLSGTVSTLLGLQYLSPVPANDPVLEVNGVLAGLGIRPFLSLPLSLGSDVPHPAYCIQRPFPLSAESILHFINAFQSPVLGPPWSKCPSPLSPSYDANRPRSQSLLISRSPLD